jgi:polyhydroxyalkanoate synthesis regulator phasin
MTRKELSQLRHLGKEIELLKQQIANIEYKASMTHDIVKGSNTSWPYEAKTFHVEGIAMPEYDKRLGRLKNKLQRRLEELMEKREELEEYVDTVPDSLIRQIITLRYINGLSWQQVAQHIGGGNTADGVRKLCNRYIKKN